ncbi:putative GIY-YIG catalytic domain-containing protein [Vibrio chagasii]|nr:putative GIY-YIG catalytic domain-containing protein [Vibrio chagasii]CAH7081926.1 putative GIY-YIG catalytic domain-containing protein [Vibrio chagasii]CAH7264098.1 putative GIY-YIG catalytic domain-containing protein [Vibrio chagasii]CAH7271172.1 putative GIY-YIG catalytic domain-containing protein [Vibrio chagasii]
MKVSIETLDVEGVIEITASEWDGKIIKMPRDIFLEWREKGDIPKTAAVYALYADHFDKTEFGKELYIGHTSTIDNRIADHLAKKEFWSVLLIFVSDNDWMNVAYTQNIEHYFIQLAKNSNRYDVKNGNDSAKTHLGVEDMKRLNTYLEHIPTILKMSGIDIFQFNLDGIYAKKERDIESNVRVRSISEKLVEILAGSQIRVSNIDELDENLDCEILNKNDYGTGICKFNKNTIVFLGDDYFPKLLGSHLSSWKNQCGVSLSNVFK